MTRTLLTLSAVLSLVACGPSLDEETQLAYEALPATLDYNADVRPVLSDRCWNCHGPDAGSRMAGLRLDMADAAYAKTAEHAAAIVPGSLSGSEMISRILSHDPEYMMPTPESNLTLTPQEKAVLVKWVEDGAVYDPHWSFTPLPAVADAEPLAPEKIDEFVRAKYEEQGLSPQGRAEPRELIRRVYRDLTGLPPTLAQTQAFVADPSQEHYAEIVDSLLASDATAEQLSREWLDVARYADSHGLHGDGERNSWPWRDWVINAFRDNKPYDEFVTEQLAGDLFEDPTEQQVIATSFNRNHVITGEGGANNEEFRMQYVMDRTNTFATAFLGLTMECAACHDHKYDPVTQAEYYSLSAFFNNVKELGMNNDDGDFGPQMMLASDETKAKLKELNKRIEQLEHSAAAVEDQTSASNDDGKAVARQIAFIKNLPQGPRPDAYVPFDEIKGDRADGYPRVGILDTLFTVPGAKGNAFYFDTQFDAVDFYMPPTEAYDPVSGSIYVKTDKREEGKWQTLFGNSGDKDGSWRGMDFALRPDGRLSFRLIHFLPGNYFEIVSKDVIPKGEWAQAGFTYDGSMSADGVTLYIDGGRVETEVLFDKLYRSIYPIRVEAKSKLKRVARSYRIGAARRRHTGEYGTFIGALDELKAWNKELTPVEMAASLIEPREPTEADRERHAEMVAARPTNNKLRTLRKAKFDAIAETMDIMVMEDMPTPRQAYRLDRGNWDSPAEAVPYATPAAVLDFDTEKYPENRLGLSMWLFDEDNPLSARVAVNRYWQHIMGRGIVGSAHDFGMQGDLPSHHELLDYLANGFRKADWDLHALLRAIVLSDTYQLSSEIDAATAEKDPDNVYLTRATAYRYAAEDIRDYALAVSGLLVHELGGPSVRPFQPEGLWLEKSTFSAKLHAYEPQSGDSLYRRSMYTFLRRTSPPPAMTALDQPDRARCIVTRERTNTPLQALVLLNDPQFVEAARVLAQAVLREESTREGKSLVEAAFAKTLGRLPTDTETEALLGLHATALSGFGESREETNELLSVGEYPLPERYDGAQLAALTVVANTVLNHDEIYMRR